MTDQRRNKLEGKVSFQTMDSAVLLAVFEAAERDLKSDSSVQCAVEELARIAAMLLDADPQPELIIEYLQQGECVVGRRQGKPVSVFVLAPGAPDSWELANIAVDSSVKGRGIGKQTLLEAIRRARQAGAAVLKVGTGNSSLDQLAFYQKAGFRMIAIDPDYFSRQYKHPILENGIPCRDRVRLELDLCQGVDNQEPVRAGIDSCRAGWLVADMSSEYAEIFPELEAFADQIAGRQSSVMIDIPLGLAEDHTRHCDRIGRELLGRRRSSLFVTPVRSAVYQPDYRSANEENRRLTGKGISIQVWNICPKIREMDRIFSHPGRDGAAWKECHPELAFAAIQGGLPLANSKKSTAGINERFELLGRVGVNRPWLEKVLKRWPRALAAPDDILDAVALSWAAALPDEQLAGFPSPAEFDRRGLPMQLWIPQLSPAETRDQE